MFRYSRSSSNHFFFLSSTLGTALIASLMLTACGPSETSADRDEQQIQADFVAKQKELQPFVGFYVGQRTDENGQLLPGTYSLSLNGATTEVTTAGRGTSQQVATLSGSIALCVGNSTDINTCAGTSNKSVVQFSTVAYQGGLVTIQGADVNYDGSVSTGGASSNITVRMVNNHLIGTWTTQNSEELNVDFVKIR